MAREAAAAHYTYADVNERCHAPPPPQAVISAACGREDEIKMEVLLGKSYVEVNHLVMVQHFPLCIKSARWTRSAPSML